AARMAEGPRRLQADLRLTAGEAPASAFGRPTADPIAVADGLGQHGRIAAGRMADLAQHGNAAGDVLERIDTGLARAAQGVDADAAGPNPDAVEAGADVSAAPIALAIDSDGPGAEAVDPIAWAAARA